MEILKLTTPAAVRTILGASDKDIADTYFVDSEIETELKLHLLDWLPAYATIISEGVVDSATDDQKNILSHLNMYAKYYCADVTSRSANFLMAQMETDGENEFQRYQNNKLEKLLDSIHRKMASHRASLITYAKNNLAGAAEVVTYSQMVKAAPDSDPVTGETT